MKRLNFTINSIVSVQEKDKLKLSADSTELVVDTTQVPSVQATHTDTVSHDSLNP